MKRSDYEAALESYCNERIAVKVWTIEGTKDTGKTRKRYAANSAVKTALSYLEGGNKVRPVSTTGCGRHTTIRDCSEACEETLKAIGIPYTIGNDAPRGGKLGKFIQIDIEQD